MEILKVHVNVTDMIEVTGAQSTVRQLFFDGYADGDFFQGTIMKGGIDTQISDKNGTTVLSARYFIEGKDCDNQSCKLFIENYAEAKDGEKMVTKPKIYTDSKALAYWESAALQGELETQNGEVLITISTVDE